MSAPMSHDRFYFFSFITMAVLCLGGFVPSFFLRAQFFDDPLPVWMTFHGVLFTLWYGIAILQSWLILKNKRALHRELGVILAIIVVSSFIITYVATAYLQAIGAHITGGARFNIILTSAFTCCVAVGFYFRRKPEVHKRLMVTATALLTVPGFDRLIRNLFEPSFPSLTTARAQMIVLGFAAVFVGIMIYRDVKEFRRPALGTMLSFLCFMIGGTLGGLFVSTDMWTAMVDSFAPSELGEPPILH